MMGVFGCPSLSAYLSVIGEGSAWGPETKMTLLTRGMVGTRILEVAIPIVRQIIII